MDEIIPKPTVKPLPIFNIALYLLIAIIVGMIGFYICLLNFEKKTESVLVGLEQALAKTRTSEEQELEKKILTYQKKINDFASLLAVHKSSKDFFKLLEENCHPYIWFSELRLDLKTFKVHLAGEAENFQAVEQQISIFRGLNGISEVNLSNISIGKEGKISFVLEISLSPELFRFSPVE